MDSVLLFQFSRAQNLIFHWKFKSSLLKIHFMLEAGILVVVNKQLELQRIQVGLTIQQQKDYALKKKENLLSAQSQPQKVAIDFTFLELAKDAKTDNTTALSESITKQDAQIRRLDLADKVSQVEFSMQPLIGFTFEQFAKQMLLQPSQAESLVDLQAEFNALRISEPTQFEEDVEMEEARFQISSDWRIDQYYNN